MSIDTSQKILKVVGILCILSGIIGIIIGILGFVGSGIIGAGIATEAVEATEEVGQAFGFAFVLGIFGVVSGVVDLLEGIFSVRAANDSAKIMPAWVFAVLGLIFAAISLVGSFGGDVSKIISGVLSVVLSLIVFIAANTIKNSR